MFLGAVRLHLTMYTKFPRPRNRFHQTNANIQRDQPYATVRRPAAQGLRVESTAASVI